MHSERLNILINNLIVNTEISFKDLSAVSVASGPGSYTGLRIGVSSAKGLCFALNIPLIAVDALFSLAEFFKSQTELNLSNALLVSMIDARRMEAFTAIYDSTLYPVKPITAEIFDENYLAELESNIPIYLLGDAQQKCKDLWSHKANFHFTDIQSDARGQVVPAYQKFEKAAFEDLVYFEPFYLKDFQIGAKKA